MVLTAFCGSQQIITVDLRNEGKNSLTFGRDPSNDIVIPSANRIISRNHGMLFLSKGNWNISDNNSTNGIRINGSKVSTASVRPGDIVTIGRIDSPEDCIILVLGRKGTTWNNVVLDKTRQLTIGRLVDNDLQLTSPVVSGHHAAITSDANGQFFIQDRKSFNGTYLQNQLVSEPRPLFPGDIISIALTDIVFTGSSLIYSMEKSGVDVVADNLVQIRKSRNKERITTDHVSLHIKRGDFVAIVGGSGSGKTTLLNELNGTDPATSGSVYVDGIDLYSNYSTLKNAIGYVPQQDIVFDNLRLFDMLCYAAELRMPPDSSKEERQDRSERVIDLLGLSKERDSYIRNLSGGQKKRASIAVELLADPQLLFLDEPTSGLDPGTEKGLMEELADMAERGRTIILVTHTTLNLDLCSQVIFLGQGGKLCYAGPPEEAAAFFGVDDFVKIYDKTAENPERWSKQFAGQRRNEWHTPEQFENIIAPKTSPNFVKQFSTLSRRYSKLLINDRQKLLLMLLQPPLFSVLIGYFAGGGCFKICEETSSCLFALSCAAFWIGVFNSIQEICKERAITKREYDGGMRLTAYVLSKVFVLGAVCLIQSALLTLVFCLLRNPLDSPSLAYPLFLDTRIELLITSFFLMFSAMSLGLWVSALFIKPDRATTAAPILVMPQIIFSGVIFKLEGLIEAIAAVIHCHWGMEAYGTSANINALPLKIYGEEVSVPKSTQTISEVTVTVPKSSTTYMGQSVPIPEQEQTLHDVEVDVPEQTRIIDSDMYFHEPDAAYQYILAHLLFDWGILILFSMICVALCIGTLRYTIQKQD